jgi:hypothetical protein
MKDGMRHSLMFFGKMAAMLLIGSAIAYGQQTPPPGPEIQVISKPMYLEWGITGGMIALVLFVIGRKSNRT